MFTLILLLQVIGLYITGDLNTILQVEYRREMLRYLYNHQVLHYYYYYFHKFIYLSFCWTLTNNFIQFPNVAFLCIIERRWRLGIAYRRGKHNVEYSTFLRRAEIAWRANGRWRWRHWESPKMDSWSRWSYLHSFMGKDMAFGIITYINKIITIIIVNYSVIFVFNMIYFVNLVGTRCIWLEWE